MQVNYFGVANCIRQALPHLVDNARIAIVSSAVAVIGVCGYAAYAPSKFALRGLAEILRVELANQNLNVTLCMPPDTLTPQLSREQLLRPSATKKIAM